MSCCCSLPLDPRADTKPIAKALLARFGTFAEVHCASVTLLQEVKGFGHPWRSTPSSSVLPASALR